MHQMTFALFPRFAASASGKWTVEFAADFQLQLTRGSGCASAPRPDCIGFRVARE